MTTQLQTFRQWFADYRGCYVIIGGTAVQLLQEQAGQPARSTRDIDLVLLLEGMSHPFYARFWEFVRAGGYQASRRTDGRMCFYRFRKPANRDYPAEIELFSRQPEGFILPEGSWLAPIPTDEGVSSLSAILLDEGYYAFLHEGVTTVEGVPILDEWHMIPLKARAWLDLSARREEGETVDRSDIDKHRKDIFRLASYIAAGEALPLPAPVAADMRAFLHAMTAAPFAPKSLGLAMDFAGALSHLASLYGLEA